MADTPSPRRVEFDHDLDTWTIDLDPPGPGGTATLQMSPGLRLLVDVAEPDRIGAILTSDGIGDSIATEDRAAVAAIFGRAALDELPTASAPGRSRRSPNGPEDLSEIRDHLGRLAIAEDLAIETTDQVVGAVAGAEAALHAEILRDNWHLTRDRPTSTTAAAQRLIALHASIAERITPDARDNLNRLLVEIASFTPTPTADQLRALSRNSEPRAADTKAAVGSWRPTELPVGRLDFDKRTDSPAAGQIRLDRRLFSPALLDPAVPAEVTWVRATGDLIVRCRVTRGAYLVALASHWVRAYRPDTRTVLALAPLEPIQPTGDEQWAEARLHIGDHDVISLIVDVTDAPKQRPPSVLRRTIEEATSIGSNAAHLERLTALAAIDAWETCAHTWHEANDTDRQALALARAENLALTARHEDQAAALRNQYANLHATWAATRLEPRPPAAPLVADLLVPAQ